MVSHAVYTWLRNRENDTVYPHPSTGLLLCVCLLASNVAEVVSRAMAISSEEEIVSKMILREKRSNFEDFRID